MPEVVYSSVDLATVAVWQSPSELHVSPKQSAYPVVQDPYELLASVRVTIFIFHIMYDI